MTANISVTSSGLRLKPAPAGRTVGSLSQQEVLTFYTVCFHTTQSTEPVPSHEEQRCTLDKLSALSQEIAPHLPPEKSALKPCWYLSPFRALQPLPQHVQRMLTTKVKFKEDEACPGCPTSQWANEILTCKGSLLTSSCLCHVLPSAQSVLCSSVQKSNLQV